MPPRRNSLFLLTASAGSGKTQYIAQKTLHALEVGEPVLAITFSRKAAAELRSRILHLATQSPTSPSLIKNLLFDDLLLETGTIDSFILRIYQHLAPFIFLPTYQELIVEEAAFLQAREQILRNFWKKLSEKRHYANLQKSIENYEATQSLSLTRAFRKAIQTLLLQSPIRIRILKNLLHRSSALKSSTIIDELYKNAVSASAKFLPDFITKALYAVLEEVMRLYRRDNRTLFLSDLQYVVELAARNVPEFVVLPYRHIKWLFLDEAQDTSLLQWTILKPIRAELLGYGFPVYIVGDPKQSIYAWRDAELSYFLALQEEAQHKLLSHNYRSRRRIISFNNRFYARVLRYLRGLASKASPKNDAHKRAASEYLIKVYTQHRQTKGRAVRPPAAPKKKHRLYPTVRVRGYSQEAELAKLLRRTLKILGWAGIPPQETAFLVRRNDDVAQLRRMLPEYDLQITSLTLGEVPSLYATMEVLSLFYHNPPALRASPAPVAKQFLEHHGVYPDLESHLLRPLPENTPLTWWTAFYVLKERVCKALPGETLFWQVFLDHLWAFLQGLVTPRLKDILSWWEEKGAETSVEVPLGPHTYPVLTIHKAKGLAWEAVLIPFTDWGFFSYKAKEKWLSLKNIASSMGLSTPDQKALETVIDSLTGLSASSSIDYNRELPLYVKSDDKNLSPLYAEGYKSAVLEGLNLHYVATTRARRVLFIYYRKAATQSKFPTNWDELHERLQKRPGNPSDQGEEATNAPKRRYKKQQA